MAALGYAMNVLGFLVASHLILGAKVRLDRSVGWFLAVIALTFAAASIAPMLIPIAGLTVSTGVALVAIVVGWTFRRKHGARRPGGPSVLPEQKV